MERKLRQYSLMVKGNSFLFGFIFSLFSLILISLNVFNIFHLGLFQYIIALFVILFLPMYPLIFYVAKIYDLMLFEKIVLTIIINISFYVIIGFFGNLCGIPLDGLFFVSITTIFYIIFIFLSFYHQKHTIDKAINERIQYVENHKHENHHFFDNKITYWILENLNVLLLSCFLILLIILYLTLVSLFNNTDVWLHLTNIKIIKVSGYLPIQNYFGAMGIYIYTVVFHFFSGFELFLIPRYFIIYSILLSSGIIYIIFKRIFRNKNLAIFGVFLLEFSSLGFIRVVNTFWPTMLAFFQSILIFYILYLRGSKFVEKEFISSKEVRKGLISSYSLMVFLFIGSLLTHSLVSTIMLISYFWVFLIYFIKDFRRGIDFLILFLLGIILFVFIGLDLGTGHLGYVLFNFSAILSYPIHYYFIGIVVVCVIIIPVIWKFVRGIKFGRNEVIISTKYKEKRKEQRIEIKWIIPILLSIVVLISTILLISNNYILNLNIQSLFSLIEIFLIGTFGTWGFIWFQKTSRGEILFIWYVGFAIFLLFAFFYDIFIITSTFWPRIVELCAIVIAIGFISYIYKLIRLEIIRNKKVKLFLVSLLTFSLLISISEISYFTKLFSLEEKEIKNLNNFAELTSEKKVVISEYGESLAIIFFDYPYGGEEVNIQIFDLHYFKVVDEIYLKPDNHIDENRTNILIDLKKKYNTGLYISLTRYYFQFGSWSFYGGLTDEEINQYYNLIYLNRICSSRDLNGNEKPVYWVI
jgi:hypothetical protein